MKLLLAALASIALPAAAHADCAIPTWIGTPSGTTIPEHGSLYIYDSGFGYDHYSDIKGAKFSDGVPHRWEETRITEELVRIDYAAGLATSVQVGVGWEPPTYQIDPQWKAPATLPRVLQFWHHVSEWTCSNSDSWMIQVDQPTAAFRVRWTHAGHVTEFIEPAQTGEDGRSVLEIGKHNCIGRPTIDLDELAVGGSLELFAIRFDGSEAYVLGMPKRLSTKELRTSEDGVNGAIGYAVAPPTPPPPPPVVTNAKSGQAFLVLAAVGVGLLFFGLLLAGRTRTPHPVRM